MIDEEELRLALVQKLDSLGLHPHHRLPYPPMLAGQDVTAPKLTTEATLRAFKLTRMN
jgi:hypothetical protein